MADLEIRVVCTEPVDYEWTEDDPRIQQAIRRALTDLQIGIAVRRVDIDPADTTRRAAA